MPHYVLNRNYLLLSKLGHSIGFVKGMPTWVPPEVVPQAQAIGAEPADGGEKLDVLGQEKAPEIHLGLDDRKKIIFDAFDKIVQVNDPKEFIGSGVPSTKAIERRTTLQTDRVELARLWADYRAMKAA